MAERTIADVARALQKYANVGGKTLTIAEHPEFGGVGGGHSPTGYHPLGQAIDIRDWRPDISPAYEGGKPKSWKERTGELRWRAKQLGIFNEVLGPGDPGHDTHVHLALAGTKYITDPQIEWLATGRRNTPEGLTDVMPESTNLPSTQLPVTKEEGDQDLMLLGLMGLLQQGQKREKTFKEKFTEDLFSGLLQPPPSIGREFLTAYMQSPLPSGD